MAQLDETDGSENIAARVVIIVLVFAVLFALISIAIVALATHNLYAAGYYTISALFDANGENSSTFIAAAMNGGAFYTVMAVSLLDGLAKAVIVGFLIAVFIDLLSA